MKRLTYEEVKEYIESFGYKLLSNEYKNNRTKLEIECDKGHIFEMRYGDFQQNRRCPICYNEHRNDDRKLTYEYVKEYIESFGYTLLSNEYINSLTKLLIKCPLGHEFEMRYGGFQQGSRCPKCKGVAKNSYEEVKDYIESFGYELLSDKYRNTKEKLKLKCPKGHEFEMRYHNFKDQGQRCPYCYGNTKYIYEEVKEYIELFGYKLLSAEYKNNKSNLLVRCDKGHEYEVTFHNFKDNGSRCPICNISKGERRIIDWLDNNNIEYIYDETYFNNLFGINGGLLRPDFILPSYKIWIEYDGEFHYKKYYESQNFETLQIHDEIKNQYAKENGWRLIRIPYWDFENIENILEMISK